MASKTQAVDVLPTKNKCPKVASNPKKLKGGTQKSITDSLCGKQGHRTSKVLSNAVLVGNRKSLQTLQPCGDESGLTRPHIMQEGKENKGGRIRPDSVDKVTVYVDPAPVIKSEKEGGKEKAQARTQDEQEAYELMVQEPIPESYWKELAEQRRQALEDSLLENEELHQANEELQREVEELKEENTQLAELAGQAQYFAAILQEAIGTDSGDDKSEHESEAKTDQPLEAATSQTSPTSGPAPTDCKETQDTANDRQSSPSDDTSQTSDCFIEKSENNSDTKK